MSGMKILMVLPYDNNYRFRASFTKSLSYMPLTLPYIAALTPKDINAEIKIADEGIERVDYDKLGFFDIVAITAVTSSARRGYELAGYFRKKGSHVAMGGHHVTLMPDEASLYADTVFIGGCDETWRQFIYDFIEKKPRRRYTAKGNGRNMGQNVVPSRGLANKKRYLGVPTVIANYGCANKCEFCVINTFWGNVNTTREISDVIEEIKGLKSKYILFLDPSPTSDREYAMGLYKSLIPLKIRWAGLCTTDITDDGELFGAMIKSGCIGVLMGFETFGQDNLEDAGKKNSVAGYKAVMKKFHDSGVAVLGTFMLGFDNDTKESLLKMPDLIEEIGVDLPRFAVLTPYPNTGLFNRLKAENRIISDDWNDYDSIHSVFRPMNMTAGELEEILVRVSNEMYTIKRIFGRLGLINKGKLIRLLVNMGFRGYNRHVGRLLKVGRRDEAL